MTVQAFFDRETERSFRRLTGHRPWPASSWSSGLRKTPSVVLHREPDLLFLGLVALEGALFFFLIAMLVVLVIGGPIRFTLGFPVPASVYGALGISVAG